MVYYNDSGKYTFLLSDRQQIPAMKKTMAATMGKIISRLPFCLQYMLCENSAPRTSTTPLNIQNIVQHHLKHFVLHAQQTIKLCAVYVLKFVFLFFG
jgi:hypothetical protein